jgi:spore coat polysaccharide biosynthesis protein SpsF (cytidylyltransferase family)
VLASREEGENVIRRWVARPDTQLQVEDGAVIGVASDESVARAVLDGVVMLNRAGGCLYVSVQRVPTGVEGEMVNLGALVEWRDRTDAKPSAEQPVSTPVKEATASVTGLLDEPLEDDLVDEASVPTAMRG